jgi:hypothetical protein
MHKYEWAGTPQQSPSYTVTKKERVILSPGILNVALYSGGQSD